MTERKYEDMLHATVLKPASSKKKIIYCEGCGIDYSKRDYKILFDNKKLVYFKLKEVGATLTLCHDCLYRIGSNIAKLKRLKEISIKITDGKKTFYFNIGERTDND